MNWNKLRLGTTCIALVSFLKQEVPVHAATCTTGDKLNTVLLLTDNKRAASSDWLAGLTVGSYAIVSIALFFFGGGSWISSSWEAWVDPAPPGQLRAFSLLILGLFVGLLDFVQIRSEVLFRRKGNERTTTVSVWLNAAAVLLIFALIPLHAMRGAALAGYLQILVYFGATVSFCLGIVIGILHVCWMLVTHSASAERFPR